MAADTDICNLALSRIGHYDLLSSLDEASKAAKLCKINYAPTRDAVLRAHPWNFAIKRVTLASDDAVIPFEYAYRFPLPSDCLKVVRTNLDAEGCPADYRIEGRALLTDESVVSIEYIAQVTDVTLYDALFVDLLAQRLAMELVIPMTDNATAYKTLADVYQAKLTEARSTDAQEGTPRDFVFDDWLRARQ